ncbi:ABC transporter permease [Saccharopolyspora sp. HNM0983]|uniref:ABC transporter permease n=1 Tax=Saccharopolyspora montiporae TaxID=2781240 RepID=A0A929G0J1_9PSEU|nr:ABC transporter permease [Saccharopolyspora sp. HNM0983]MBE9373658.1 ABC transporter permease [Saccharopolyspora sp. HNM0983]
MTRTSTEPGTAARTRVVLRRWLGRAASAALVVWGAATAAFLAQIAQPGDRATSIINLRSGQTQERTPEELAPINAQYGFDQPVLVQYGDYLAGLLRGDLGISYQQHRPVLDLIGEQIGPTILLTATALVLAWLLMLAWVLLTAGRTRRISALSAAVDTVLAGLPQYWIGVLLLLAFALGLGWFPVLGGSGLAGTALPALALALPLAGFLGQATRTEFERVLAQPFVLSARTRGTPETVLRLRHVLRHAAPAPLMLTGWALGATVSGAVIVETLFTRRGIGRTLVTAVEAQDLPVVTGIVVLIALLYVAITAVVDALHLIIDPRLTA